MSTLEPLRRKLVAGNWKMHLGPGAARSFVSELVDELQSATPRQGRAELAVFPPFLSLPEVASVLRGTGVLFGSQDVHAAPSGAFTGAVSAEMVRATGATHAIVGHSERRQHFGETDADVGAKVRACLRAGLLPIVCVGESSEERDRGVAEGVVTRQLLTALEGLHADQVPQVTVAYEPVWAIGTGRTATPAQAQAMHSHLRTVLGQAWPGYVARQTRILYGGSMKPQNASELLSQPDIDGGLIGGASLEIGSFLGILKAASNGSP